MTTDLTHTRSGLGPATATPDLLSSVGWADPDNRSMTTVLLDHGYAAMDSRDDDVVVLPLAQALLEYPWVQDLMFSLIDPDEDEVLRRAFESTREPLGTFTWVKEGAHVDKPTQTFSVMTVPQERQFVHDITVIGAGATVDEVSGSAVAPELTHGSHVSVSETFVGAGATVRSVDVDRWGKEMNINTYSRTKMDKDSTMSSVSVAVSGVHKSVDDSHVELAEGAKYTSHMVVFAPTGTERVMNSTATLGAAGAQAEMVSRMVSDGGVIRNSSTLVGGSADVRGFLECDGLLLGENGAIESVPALDAKVARAQLSHEASVGMIDDEKIDYLTALGLDEDAARDLIVQGFLNLDDDRIPVSVRARVENLVSAAREAENF
ncbi:SufD family Fe-S cluster assembly protein [Corynebacterium sp. TAE3-ERU12]|uniref:SufD family Fe-S cluster assembly protein n=1 Tax=Corynebacterium sp. TAE3-ERU12 TaxID=2849491 RepID=UPI001C44BECD|nr:SufD family Fe-S cluster assembly protein [Corynebacterium sp. TAE3-ERU12]MBV7295166.1 SufD family Fe-S cluster assembly protein [Corynebacterium sp. TAE3-ERU12]